jgi:small neutral amino acid transporter SnatA (MarC family)
VPPKRRRVVALRESLTACAVLAAFMVGGQAFQDVMRLSERSLEVAGGVILLIIAIRMIFWHSGGAYEAPAEGKEPLIIPLAVPLLAGPSTMAVSATVVLTAVAVEMILAGLKRYFLGL